MMAIIQFRLANFHNSIQHVLRKAITAQVNISASFNGVNLNSCCMKGMYKNAAIHKTVIPMINGTRLFLYLNVTKTVALNERLTSVRKILLNKSVMKITERMAFSSYFPCR